MLTRSVGMIYETFPGTKGGSGVKTCLRLSKAEAEGTKAVAPSRPPSSVGAKGARKSIWRLQHLFGHTVDAEYD